MTTPPPMPPQQPGQQPDQPYGQPYGQQYTPPPAPKKRKIWPWVLGGVILVFILIIGGCAALFGGVANEIDKESKSTATVTYRVNGEGDASITFTDKDTNMAQDTATSLPWTKDVELSGFGKYASVTATNGSDASAGQAITCEIVVNGQVKNTQTSKGPFATASCHYTVSSDDTE